MMPKPAQNLDRGSATAQRCAVPFGDESLIFQGLGSRKAAHDSTALCFAVLSGAPGHQVLILEGREIALTVVTSACSCTPARRFLYAGRMAPGRREDIKRRRSML